MRNRQLAFVATFVVILAALCMALSAAAAPPNQAEFDAHAAPPDTASACPGAPTDDEQTTSTASNCIFLAQRGFRVTGVDYAPAAIEPGRERPRDAGVTVNFVEDNPTDLRHAGGPFDLLVDYGTLDHLSLRDRDLYVPNAVPPSRPGSRFLLYWFEWQPRCWERALFSRMACAPGEIERAFGPTLPSSATPQGRTALGGCPPGPSI